MKFPVKNWIMLGLIVSVLAVALTGWLSHRAIERDGRFGLGPVHVGNLRLQSAYSGQWAFTRETDHIQLVIMDKSMPFMNGAATINALRTIKPTVKLLEASGHGLQTLTETDFQINANARIEKPFTVGQLVTAVHTVLNPA